MRDIFPPLEPYKTGRLKVSSLHEIYYEEAGNPKGSPVIFVHGGPGGGIHPEYRRFFDPQHYRIILFDQRGAGQSTPHAELEENTTWDLVEDMEKIRGQLDIDRWFVFGGSWGSTLSLIYAITHPERVKALILRGIFLCRPHEIHWFYQEGASRIFPDMWEHYLKPIPPHERSDLVKAYYKRLTSSDAKTRLEAAQAWSVWEASTSKLIPDEKYMDQFGEAEFALAFARIECHYFTNNIFMPTTNYILENVHKIHAIPGHIVHGRYDLVCPIENAWDLHKSWPKSQLHIIPDAGHAVMEKGIRSRLVQIMDDFKTL